MHISVNLQNHQFTELIHNITICLCFFFKYDIYILYIKTNMINAVILLSHAFITK